VARYHGKRGVVYLSTTGSGVASLLTAASWSLSRATDKVPVTSFADANKVYVQGLPDITGQLSAFWDDTDTKLFTAADSADGCKMYLYPSSDAVSKYHYGAAWLDASMSVDVNGAVAVTANFVAAGSWGKTL
jgi:hypothetical protein